MSELIDTSRTFQRGPTTGSGRAFALSLVAAVTCLVAAFIVARQPVTATLYLVASGLLLFVGFFHPRVALYLIIFSMLLSPELGVGMGGAGRPVTVRLEDLLLILVGCAWIVRVAYYKQTGFLRKCPLNRPIAAYALAALLATAVSGWLGPFNWLKAFFFLAKYLEYFILFFLVLNMIESRRDIERYLGAALVTSVIVSVVGIAQIPTGARVSAPFEGKVGEPNTFGGYLVLMIALAGAFYLVTPSFRRRLLWAGLLGLAAIPLLYTLSRTSWGAALGSFAVLFALGPRKSHLFAAGVLALALYPVLGPTQVLNRVDYTFNQPESHGQVQVGRVHLDTSLSARIESWGYGLEGWARRPITGYGVSGFAFLDAQYILVLTETGIVGLGALAWLAWSIAWLAIRRYRSATDPFARALSLGYLAGFAGLLVHGIGANTFIIVRIMEPFWLLTALVVALPDHPKPPDASASGPIGRLETGLV